MREQFVGIHMLTILTILSLLARAVGNALVVVVVVVCYSERSSGINQDEEDGASPPAHRPTTLPGDD